MDAIEKAIRNAFERGNPGDRAFREKVYRSAFAALDRALQASPNMTAEVVEHRRTQLGRRISEIESEFIPAVAPAPDAVPQAAPEIAVDPAPRHDAGTRAAPMLDPDIDRPAGAGRRQAPGYDDVIDAPEPDYPKPARRGRPWAASFIGITVLSLAVIGGWWAYDTGLFRSPDAGDGSVPNPPATVEDEDYRPAEPPRIPGDAAGLEDWIVVFDPADPTTVTAPGDSSAEVTEADGQAFLRIRSGASGSPVLFDVGQGILEQVAGRRAVFAIVAQAEEGAGTTMSVDCNLGELGDCGRKRYAVGTTREEFLFEIELPDTDPGAGGTIAINPDIDGGGKVVDVHTIRVSPAQ